MSANRQAKQGRIGTMTLLRAGNGILAAPKRPMVLGLLGLVLTILIGFGARIFSAATEASFGFDRLLHDGKNPVSHALAKLLDGLDKPTVVAVILILLGIAVTFWRGWMPALGVVLVVGFGWLLTAIVKLLVAEPRPSAAFDPSMQEQALSFPSGHVAFVAALTVGVGAVLAGSRWRWPAVIALSVLAVVTAYTRLYLGVHYPVDVLGGMLGGVAGAVFTLGIWNTVVRLLAPAGSASRPATSRH